jgi:hypothetical protein
MDRALSPQRHVVLGGQLELDPSTLATGSTIEVAQVVAVDGSVSPQEVGGATVYVTPSELIVKVCDGSGTACWLVNSGGIANRAGWYPFRVDLTLGDGTVAVAWEAYGLLGGSPLVSIIYSGPMVGVRTRIGARSNGAGALVYWDDVTIDWY